MRCCTSIPTLIAVGALAFAAGRFGWPEAETAHAQGTRAQEQKGTGQAQPPEMDAAMAEAMQKANEIGDAHKQLNAFLGDWKMDLTFHMAPGAPPMKATGTVHREWVLDGHFLQESVEGHMADMPETFHGLGYLGFDSIEGVYESAWLENMNTSLMTETGYYDAAAKKFHFRGAHRDPVTGRTVPTRSVIDVSNANRHVFVGYAIAPDGSEYKQMEGSAERTSTTR